MSKEKYIDYIKQECALYANVFGTESGKKLLEKFKADTFISRSTVPSSSEINRDQMIWNEAQRAFVLKIINMSDSSLVEKQIQLINEREKSNGQS
jgi:hypothetical protein